MWEGRFCFLTVVLMVFLMGIKRKEKANQTYFEPSSIDCMIHIALSLQMQETVAFKVHFINRTDVSTLEHSFLRFSTFLGLGNAHTLLPQGWLSPWRLFYCISQPVSKNICEVGAPV